MEYKGKKERARKGKKARNVTNFGTWKKTCDRRHSVVCTVIGTVVVLVKFGPNLG